MKLVELG